MSKDTDWHPEKSVQATCHCGAILVVASRKPYTAINDCQCSICKIADTRVQPTHRLSYSLLGVSANCFEGYRYGAAWAYYKKSEVDIVTTEKGGMIELDGKPWSQWRVNNGTTRYIWADGTIEFHFCELCGCCVYWWPTDKFPKGYDEMGLNTKMMDPEVVKGLNRKVTYTYESQDGC